VPLASIPKSVDRYRYKQKFPGLPCPAGQGAGRAAPADPEARAVAGVPGDHRAVATHLDRPVAQVATALPVIAADRVDDHFLTVQGVEFPLGGQVAWASPISFDGRGAAGLEFQETRRGPKAILLLPMIPDPPKACRKKEKGVGG
jgi:hypothetical protein